MKKETGWKADTQDTDALLADLETLDPEAYRAGQAALIARDRRLDWLASLARKRENRGLGQTRVASRMATSQSAVARLEGGLSDPKLSTLQRYADAIGYDLSLSLTPKSETSVTIQVDDLARILTEASKAIQAISSQAISSRIRQKISRAKAFRLSDAELRALSVEMEPGDVTISGQVSSMDQLTAVFDKVYEYTPEKRITVEVDIGGSVQARR